ncbi:hypothetical protein CTEN210_11595 [Chaetoceros tenuissimus]|uniref:RING-type domain-containing protein n=1 Tax=Chaetoceros tenuissimus TaxID=426638 RepID=A0AAD3D010_9STRA|nr:hypothetical protein CTEN210_11595 [Chaetoceros tenuissimus]
MDGKALFKICSKKEWTKLKKFLDSSEIGMEEKEKILSYQEGKRWEKRTCLMICICKFAPEELILKMIRIGKKSMLLKQIAKSGHTVLHLACDAHPSHGDGRYQPFPVLKEMIDIGGRDLIMTKARDDNCYALHYLCWTYDCRKKIDEYKRKIEYILEKGDRKLLLLEKSQPPDGSLGFTALDYASKGNAPDSICELLACDVVHLQEDSRTDSRIQSKLSNSRSTEEDEMVEAQLVAKVQNEDKAVRIYLEESRGASRIERDTSSIINCEEDAKKIDIGASLPICLEEKVGGIRQRNLNQSQHLQSDRETIKQQNPSTMKENNTAINEFLDNSSKDGDDDLEEELQPILDNDQNKIMLVQLKESETTCFLCKNEFSTDTDSKDKEVRDRLPVISASKTCSHYYCFGCVRSLAMSKNVANGKPLDKWLECSICRSNLAFRYEEKAPKYHCLLISLIKRAKQVEKDSLDIQVNQRGKEQAQTVEHTNVSNIQHVVKSSYEKDVEEVKELYSHQLHQANEKWAKKNGKLLAENGQLLAENGELEVENKILKRKLEELQTHITAEN